MTNENILALAELLNSNSWTDVELGMEIALNDKSRRTDLCIAILTSDCNKWEIRRNFNYEYIVRTILNEDKQIFGKTYVLRVNINEISDN